KGETRARQEPCGRGLRAEREPARAAPVVSGTPSIIERLEATPPPPYVHPRDTPPQRGAPIWKDRPCQLRSLPCGRLCRIFPPAPAPSDPAGTCKPLTARS